MQQLARSTVVEGEPLLRQRLVGTAAVYWRKFYLRNDFGVADPRLLAPACLFLASKTGGVGVGVGCGGQGMELGTGVGAACEPGWVGVTACAPCLSSPS